MFIADYVLMGYGTGAIMAVPAHDQRDFEFADEFHLPVVGVVRPPDAWFEARGLSPDAPASEWPEAYTGDGVGMASSNDSVSLDGLGMADAKDRIIGWLEEAGAGEAAVTYKLRDWLFSRQRYWGEPFPIVYDTEGVVHALPESMLPVELPDITDFEPRILADDDTCAARTAAGAARPSGCTCSSIWVRGCASTGARRTRCRSGRGRVGTTCATSTPRTRTRSSIRRSSGTGWVRAPTVASTSTSAAPSTRCCTSSTRASGTRCSSTSGTCRRPSRSTASSTRARSPRRRTPTSAARTSRRRRWRSATGRGSTTASRSSATTARWARA